MTKRKKFKTTYNFEIILGALNSNTNEEFIYDAEDDEFVSKNFTVEENGWYEFTVNRVIKNKDTGFFDFHTLGYELTIAETIDEINKENGDLK